MSLEFRNFLKNELKEHKLEIAFTKTNGKRRDMVCTLNPKYMPEVPKKTPKAITDEVKKPRKDNDEVLAVWDVESEGWRSFKINSLIRYTVLVDEDVELDVELVVESTGM